MTDKTVLIVEDNALNMKLVMDVLKIEKIKGLAAENAEKGFELARHHLPDLILMDIELPGMDGLSAIRKIKADPVLGNIPIIALSAYAMEEDKALAEEAGCDGYITKPIKISLFRETLKNYLGNRVELYNRVDKRPSLFPAGECKSGKRILVVDDELNVKLLSAHLISRRYEVITAFNGDEAIRKVGIKYPDLILLDIMMLGMDGYQVTSKLKSDPKTKDIPIILVTALTGEDEKKKGLAAGADEFINKPIDTHELDARIVSLLRLREYGEQLGSRKQSEELFIRKQSDQIRIVNNPKTLPTVLIVDDDPMIRELLTIYISDIDCNIETAENGEKAIKLVNEKKIDIMILDLLLPDMDGFDVCRKIKEYEKTYPIQVVIVTSLTDTRSKIEGIEAGTDDFLLKPVSRDELKARLLSLFKKKAYLDQLIVRTDNALNAAITDKMTGVYNHGYFKNFLTMELNRAERHGHKLALLMIDIDDFKKFNDRYGHPCGDEALKIIASIIRENIRKVDLLARYGGEEFAIILPYLGLEAAEEIATRILEKVNNHCEIPFASDGRLSVSIGLSIFPDHISDANALIKTADCALYMAKRNGKNRVAVYSEISESTYTDNIYQAGFGMIHQVESFYKNEINTSFRDSLTGLFNHGFFLIYLEQELLRSNRSGNSFSLAMLDIDELGMLNQKQGPGGGDRLLRDVGEVINKTIRGVDIAARYGGDRFIIIFVGACIKESMDVSERIRTLIENEIDEQITVSIGLASFHPGSQNSIGSIIDEAQSALMQAKTRGKNMVCCYKSSEKKYDDKIFEILLVDDDPLNLKYLEGLLQPIGYSTHRSKNGSEAIYIINNMEIDLVLLDVMMPDMDGFEVCRKIKTNEDTRMIPVILITALDDTETKIRGIDAGADDFISKPPNKAELLARVKSLLRLKRLNNNLTSIENVLFSMAKAVESKDSYTQGHVDRVSQMAISIGKDMGVSNSELEALRFGGILHDIGKMGVPSEILNKPGPLNDEEWEIMKRHPEIGYRICLPLKKNLGNALDIVRHHHEKLDGSGYPDGLRNDEISMVARIMAVADIYDALITDRPYRKGMSMEKTLDILYKEADAGKLDFNVVVSIDNLVADKEFVFNDPELRKIQLRSMYRVSINP